MKISDLMTENVVTCRTKDSLNRVAQLMWEHRCGCTPVLDETDRVVGLLTDRDLCMAAYTQGRRLDDMPVTSAMSRPVWTCLPSASVEEVEDIMMAHGVRRIVVAGPEGRLSGLVSLEDIARSGAEWDGRGTSISSGFSFALAEVSRRNTNADEDGPELPDTDMAELVRNSVEVLRTLRDEIRVESQPRRQGHTRSLAKARDALAAVERRYKDARRRKIRAREPGRKCQAISDTSSRNSAATSAFAAALMALTCSRQAIMD